MVRVRKEVHHHEPLDGVLRAQNLEVPGQGLGVAGDVEYDRRRHLEQSRTRFHVQARAGRVHDDGSEGALREKGLIRSEGKEYTVKDGDVCHFKFAN